MRPTRIMAIGWLLISVASGAQIWVSPQGSDANPGTQDRPMATLHMALRKAREMRRLKDPAVKEGIYIHLDGGRYQLYEPVLIRPEDSGTKASPTVIRATEGQHPVLSGGLVLTGWQRLDVPVPGLPERAESNIWVTDAPRIAGRILEFRQMWVDNRKAVCASTFDDGWLDRILAIDRRQQCLWIPRPQQLPHDMDGVELVLHQCWAIAILRVKSIEPDGSSAKVTFWQPESRIQFEHPWPPPIVDPNRPERNSAFWLANSIEFLDRPGEWYQDLRTGKVYYWPRDGEDMTCCKVIVPALETLVSIEGTLDRPVSYIQFENIGFAHTTWLRPSRAGHVPLQAGMYILDAYKLQIPGTPDKSYLENQAWIGRQPAAVEVRCAENLRFHRCSFEHLAATGLDLVRGTHHNLVQGCIFSDIGGTAIQVGFFGDAAFEAHLPYNPTDKRELCRYERIENNLITDCTNEDWGCVGISVGYAHDITIAHNELSDLNYSGICVGWGWTRTRSCMKDNKVIANHIHHFAKNMYDVGGIYTLSCQPGTVIAENSIHDLQRAPYAHDPNHYQYIYLDENSSYIKVINNWTEQAKFFSNTPGPGNIWRNNGPQVSERIRQQAGLEPRFRDLLEYVQTARAYAR
ncbi:MAG: right-handed parallel beta-helix repeat-containing protein [Sedimentisphaerales bacterium]|nr:right-handed parallel beta-helix repeat-containing protein [Sedimentisphaerales bacterium]